MMLSFSVTVIKLFKIFIFDTFCDILHNSAKDHEPVEFHLIHTSSIITKLVKSFIIHKTSKQKNGTFTKIQIKKGNVS